MDEKIWNLFFSNLQKIMFPEAWMVIDLSISRMELMALLLVWVNSEIIMTQLAEDLDIPMSTATGIVSRLVKKGYIERITDETNRRIVTVRLTDIGKNVAENIKKTIINYLNLILNSITDDEKEILYKLCSKIIMTITDPNVQNEQNDKSIKKIVIE